MKLYCGLDIHKKTIYGTIMEQEGKIIQQGEFENSQQCLQAFLSGMPMTIVIEACGFWMDVYDRLTDMGYEVVLAHPGKVEAIASAMMKTDKIDSEILAHLLRGNLIPRSWAPPKDVRDQRDLVRFRCTLIRQRSQLKNRIKAVLLKRGIKYRQDIWQGKGRFGIERLGDEKIAAYYRLIDAINKEANNVSKQINALNKEDYRASLLTSIYGIGDYAARVILAEVGDISRFPSAKKLKSYAGLTPRLYQSGQRTRTAGITHRGSVWLRWILVQCVHVAAKQKESKIGAFYHRLCQKKKKQVAAVAAACKMLDIIYAMLRDAKPYIA